MLDLGCVVRQGLCAARCCSGQGSYGLENVPPPSYPFPESSKQRTYQGRSNNQSAGSQESAVFVLEPDLRAGEELLPRPD
jgi:hypothetical protein